MALKILKAQHRNSAVEGAGDARHNVAGDGAPDHRLETKARYFPATGRSEGRNASYLDGDGDEVRKPAERIGHYHDRARIQCGHRSLARCLKMSGKVSIGDELRQYQLLAEHSANDEAILNWCSHCKSDGPVQPTQDELQGQ